VIDGGATQLHQVLVDLERQLLHYVVDREHQLQHRISVLQSYQKALVDENQRLYDLVSEFQCGEPPLRSHSIQDALAAALAAKKKSPATRSTNNLQDSKHNRDVRVREVCPIQANLQNLQHQEKKPSGLDTPTGAYKVEPLSTRWHQDSNGEGRTPGQLLVLRQLFESWRRACPNLVRVLPSEKQGSWCWSQMARENVQLLPFWEDIGHLEKSASRVVRDRSSKGSARPKKKEGAWCDEMDTFNTPAPRPSQKHLTKYRMPWEVIGVAMISYDLATIPLLVFGPILEVLTLPMQCISAIYWTIDIVFYFMVLRNANACEKRPALAAFQQYLKTWLIPDVLIAGCDWALVVFDLQGGPETRGPMGYLKVGRWLRFLRFARLIRLAKLHFFFDKVIEQFYSEYLLTILRVSKLIIFILVSCHIIACVWYGIGQLGSDRNTWIKENFHSDDSWTYRYSTSLHWALTQFTPASMEVTPTNSFERAFNVCVVVFAMVMFSSFISSITEAMTHLRKINVKRSEQYDVMRQYMADNEVSVPLAQRVWSYLEQRVKIRKNRKLWQDVELFSDLPNNMQVELHYEVYYSVIAAHPFFFIYNEANNAGFKAICHKVAAEASVTTGQIIFNEGEVADKMYFVMQGVLDYFMVLPETDTTEWKSSVSQGEWACEASFWVQWYHIGRMMARVNSTVLTLQASAFHSVMKQYAKTLQPCCKYANSFFSYLQTKNAKCSDVGIPSEIVQAITEEAFEEPFKSDGRTLPEYTSEKRQGLQTFLSAFFSLG